MSPGRNVSLIPGLFLLLTITVQSALAQQARQAVVTKRVNDSTQKVKPGGFPGNKSLLGVSLALTSGMTSGSGYPNPLGIEFEFMFRPTQRHKESRYYIGVNFSITGGKEETPYTIPGGGTVNGSMKSEFNTMFFGISQYCFLSSRSNTKPFLELDLGVRDMRNFVDVEYDYINPIIPGIGGWDKVVKKTGSQFSAGFKIGFFFQVLGARGIFIKTGIATGGDFDVCQNGSVTSTGKHVYTYETVSTNASYFSFNVGLML